MTTLTSAALTAADFPDSCFDQEDPSNFEVKTSNNVGVVSLDKVALRAYSVSTGYELLKELKGEPVLGREMLAWFLENPRKIPEEFRGKKVPFWGTIYTNHNSCGWVARWWSALRRAVFGEDVFRPDGDLFVECLVEELDDEGRPCGWTSLFVWLFNNFDSSTPAAMAL